MEQPETSVTVTLPTDLRQWLRVHAALTEQTQSEIVRRLLERERAKAKR